MQLAAATTERNLKGAYMENTIEFTVSTQFYEYALVEGEPDEVERLLDALWCPVHRVYVQEALQDASGAEFKNFVWHCFPTIL